MNLSTATPRQIDEKIASLEELAWRQNEIKDRAVLSLRYAVRDRQVSRTGWKMTEKEVLNRVRDLLDNDERADFIRFAGSSEDRVRKNLDTIAAAEAEWDRLTAEINLHEDEYRRRPWSRFFKLRSTPNARIHDSRWCGGLHRSNHADLGWHPELSGKSEEEAVAELGPVMCSKCFRSAPVEWRQDPKNLKPADPDACPGAEEPYVPGTMKFHRTYNGGENWATCTGCEEKRKVRADGKVAKHKKPKGK